MDANKNIVAYIHKLLGIEHLFQAWRYLTPCDQWRCMYVHTYVQEHKNSKKQKPTQFVIDIAVLRMYVTAAASLP